MEGLQTTETGEATLTFNEAETEGGVKGANKKERKELFQINTVRYATNFLSPALFLFEKFTGIPRCELQRLYTPIPSHACHN